MELTHLADTSVLIDPPLQPVIDGPHLIVTSVVCLGELEAGVLLAAPAEVRAGRLRRLTAVTATVPALPVDAAVASHYAEIRAASGRAPASDLWIAATARSRALVLITRDDKLSRIQGLSTLLVS
ncbi:MAG: type II toxin-antitoxin system VapC family toxin [Solirubrobacteraceae bacterium]